MRSAFKSAYIQLEHPAIVVPPNEILEAVAEVSSTPIGGEDGASSTRSLIEDLQADLHNEAIRAFGIWRVFVSSRAENDLRVTSRRDFQRFKIIMRKIRRVYHNRVTGDADCNLVSNHRELSSGHFSAENHIMLMGVENGIPVYEAKLVGNSRLVVSVNVRGQFSIQKSSWVVLHPLRKGP